MLEEGSYSNNHSICVYFLIQLKPVEAESSDLWRDSIGPCIRLIRYTYYQKSLLSG